MAHIGLVLCKKQGSTTTSSSRGSRTTPTPNTNTTTTTTTTTAAADDDGHCRSCGVGRLMRKLRKQSKLLFMATRPAAFHCQYDPLSYSRNFDHGFGTALDDDSTNFYYTFSSRFVDRHLFISHLSETNNQPLAQGSIG